MITQEYGKHFGVCDCCGEEVTPRFDTFNEASAFMKANDWKTQRNKTTGAWENFCPECRKLENF